MSVYRRHNFVSLISHSFQQACCQVFNVTDSTLATAEVDSNAVSLLNSVSSYYPELLFVVIVVYIVGVETTSPPLVCPLPLPVPLYPSRDPVSSRGAPAFHSPSRDNGCLQAGLDQRSHSRGVTTHPLLSGKPVYIHIFTPCCCCYCLFQLETPEEDSCLTSNQISDFVIFLQNDFLSNQPYSLVLSPLIYPHSSDISMATLLEPAMSRVSAVTDLSGLLLELGYSSTRDREEVLLLLQQFSVNQLTPGCLAKVLGLCYSVYSYELTNNNNNRCDGLSPQRPDRPRAPLSGGGADYRQRGRTRRRGAAVMGPGDIPVCPERHSPFSELERGGTSSRPPRIPPPRP